jgi:hypothetical protein
MADEWLRLENKAGAAEAIRRLGEDDLVFLNHLIVERLKLIAQAKSTVLMAGFSVGDRVSFLNHAGQAVTGSILRLNKKSASILTEGGHHWKVHPGYLKHA